jgi:polyhydroxybutyrate depolymerase
MFHGGGIDADIQEGLTHLSEKSDSAGFILVRPDGSGPLAHVRTWNAGNCCAYAMEQDVDDVGFARELVAAVSAELCVDSRRVYATGFSNGAMMTHRLACELDDVIAAVAPVSGGIGIDDCSPLRPVPVFEIHGLADEAYPFGGGTSTCSSNPTDFRSITETIMGWGQRNDCASTSHVTLHMGDVTCRAYDGCPAGGDVELCLIDGGKHDWPDGTSLGGPCSGTPTTDLAANDAIWDFFSAHSLPEH